MSARGILVTGTDTGVGKTLVGCALAAALAETSRVAVFKPAETGCLEIGGELRPDDAVRLREASGSSAPLELICPYRYAEPLAPAIAATRAGRPISIERLKDAYGELTALADVALVESAGGLLVPLTERFNFADLAAFLDLSVLLVVGSRLGALNQTLLTLDCARRRNLRVIGYVVNQISRDRDLAQETNAAALAALADVPRLATIDWIERAGGLDRPALARIGRPIQASVARIASW